MKNDQPGVYKAGVHLSSTHFILKSQQTNIHIDFTKTPVHIIYNTPLIINSHRFPPFVQSIQPLPPVSLLNPLGAEATCTRAASWRDVSSEPDVTDVTC